MMRLHYFIQTFFNFIWHLETFLSFMLFFLSLFYAAESRYDERRFTVLRVPVHDQKQFSFLQSLYLNSTEFHFWREPTLIGHDVHVMMRHDQRIKFEKNLIQHGFIGVHVMIEDVEKTIKTQCKKSRRMQDAPIKSLPHRSGRAIPTFSMMRYHTFAEIINYMNTLAINFPDRVRVQPIGTTHEGRQIPLIRVGTNLQSSIKPAIWIDGGIHAREWVSPAAVLYFIQQLITEYDNQALIKNFVDQLDWFIVPLLNPDGYEYSRSSSDPEVRLWRKNRSPQVCTQVSTGLFSPPRLQCCQGVDLNRNFDWFFGQVGSSTDPCSEIYSGSLAFSEPETRAVRDFITQLGAGRIRTFLTFHSYSQILMYPYGHALRTYSQDVGDLGTTARRAAQALQSIYGTRYTVGTGADTLYPASGGSEDWAKGRMGIKFSYLFELRPEDNVYDGFLLPENQILPTARETWEAVKVIAGETMRQFSIAHSRPAARLCRDLDVSCGAWAANGACVSWPGILERCPATCGLC